MLDPAGSVGVDVGSGGVGVPAFGGAEVFSGVAVFAGVAVVVALGVLVPVGVFVGVGVLVGVEPAAGGAFVAVGLVSPGSVGGEVGLSVGAGDGVGVGVSGASATSNVALSTYTVPLPETTIIIRTPATEAFARGAWWERIVYADEVGEPGPVSTLNWTNESLYG